MELVILSIGTIVMSFDHTAIISMMKFLCNYQSWVIILFPLFSAIHNLVKCLTFPHCQQTLKDNLKKEIGLSFQVVLNVIIFLIILKFSESLLKKKITFAGLSLFSMKIGDWLIYLGFHEGASKIFRFNGRCFKLAVCFRIIFLVLIKKMDLWKKRIRITIVS